MEREILIYTLSFLCVLLIGLVLYSSILPSVIYGDWSAPTISPCAGTKNDSVSYYEYECNPNSITGFGCMVPGTKTGEVTYKNIVIPQICQIKDLREITYSWRRIDEKSVNCHSDGRTCCNSGDNQCYTDEYYYCNLVGAPGGENKCTLNNLPGVPYPPGSFRPSEHQGYTDPADPINTRSSCIVNICSSS